MFKRTLLAACTAVALAACGQNVSDSPASSAADNTVQKTAANNNTMRIATARGDVDVPSNPAKIAVFDLASLDTLEALGVPVAGSPKKVFLPYLQPVVETANDIGTVFEPNLEVLNALKPQLIIISGRTASKYDDLAGIATTIDMSDSGQDLFGDGLKRLDTYGKLFGKTEKAQQLHDSIQKQLDATRQAVRGKGNALMIMVNGGKLSAFSEQSRFGWIFKDLGIPAADTTLQTSLHGQPVSFEYIQKINPDWLFVLDRGAAIGEEGKSAKSVLDNELVRQTKAWKQGHVIYLSSASYIASGGVQQMQTELNNIQAAFAHAK